MNGKCLFRKSLFAAFIVFATCGIVLPQKAKASLGDLAGEWRLVPEKSDSRTGVRYIGGNIKIKVSGDEVHVIRNLESQEGLRELDMVLYSDGRGESNFFKSLDGSTDIEKKTRTKWKGNKLVSVWSYKGSFGWAEVEEVYELADNGESLILRVRPSMLRGGRMLTGGPADRLLFKKVVSSPV